MLLHRPTLRVPRLARATAVAVATTCIATGAATVAIADNQAAPKIPAVADIAMTPYLDIEANKASSMRALGSHLAEQAEDRALAQERYYQSFGKHAMTHDNVTPAAHRALAQERYYMAYGNPTPSTTATRTVTAGTGDGIAPLPFVIALFGALIVGLGAGTGLHLLHVRRRYHTQPVT